MAINNVPYVPLTGLASRPSAAQQHLATDPVHQKPLDLFDPNFIGQASNPEQLQRDLNVVESIFGAQKMTAPFRQDSAVDLSQMSERDRRIFLRDQERRLRNQGNVTSATAYGVAEPPPVKSTGANIFGEQPPVASNLRDQVWQQKMAQRQMQQQSVPTMPQISHQSTPPQGQGFTPASIINQQVSSMPGAWPSTVAGIQMPSPNTANRKIKAIGQSPLRQSNILTSAAAQKSPIRSSFTAQKLQQAKDLDFSIQSSEHPYSHQQSQRHSTGAGSGLPPSGASPAIRKDAVGSKGGLLDALGNNETDLKRKQDYRVHQQNEYNKYLAQQQQQQQQPAARHRSAGGHQQVSDAATSLQSGGLQMIGGYQARQFEDKQRMQREYQNQLNEQMLLKQQKNVLSDSFKLSEARKKQLSDQVFSELVAKEPEVVRQHLAFQAGFDQQSVNARQLPSIHQPMQQPNRPGLPPRIQSAVGSNRREEVEKLQRQAPEDNPFHKNRQDGLDAKRSALEKKREYAAMLQAQMAQKKQQKESQLPLPERLFEQQPPSSHEQREWSYPPHQQVDFTMPQFQPPMPQNQHQKYDAQLFQTYEQPQSRYSMDQQVSFDPEPLSSGYPPLGYPNAPLDPHRQRSRSPNQIRIAAIDESSQQNLMQQRSRQEEYRRQLEEQMKLNEEKKRRIKEENERYERINNKDMAQYMQGGQTPEMFQGVTGAFPSYDTAGGEPIVRSVGGNQQATAIRLGTDITKPQALVDPAKQMAKLKYQEEIKQQMEEARARKEAQKRQEKAQDEELERRIMSEQQRLTQQEIADIKKEGKREAPEIKPNRQVRIDAFQTSQENNGVVGGVVRQNNFMEQPTSSRALAEPPTVTKKDAFISADNFTLQPTHQVESKFDLYGGNTPAQSMMHPEANFLPGGPGAFGALPPPAPSGGLQSPFGQAGFGANSSQFSQFAYVQPPPSAPLPNQYMASQSEWMQHQQSHATKMFEDQQKMIGMYQQALEQILQYRNQYFEQAMAMRENILKEREQLFEYEKLKQQQLIEMTQLRAVQSQLGDMLSVADQRPVLNPQVASNLNSYISKQKEQILQMSQSQSSMSKLIREAQQQQQHKQIQNDKGQRAPPQKERELRTTNQHVQIPKKAPNQFYSEEPQQIMFSPPSEDDDMDLQKQVDDLAAQIEANDIDQNKRRLTSAQAQRLSGHDPAQLAHLADSSYGGEYARNPAFEQSLSSQSKMVKVPNQNLLAKAAQAAQDTSLFSANKPQDVLTETWNEQSAQKALAQAGVFSPQRQIASKPQLQLSDNHRLVTPKRIGGNLIGPRSPIHNTSLMPQTIEELPQEEEKHQTNADGMRSSAFEFQNQAAEKRSDYDWNNRELSNSSSPPRHQLVSIEAREEMEKIERLVQQQTQSAWADRRAAMTGSSFYENHRRTQKLQEQTQQEEIQRQLMRILGSTSQSVLNVLDNDPLKAMQQDNGPDTERELNLKNAELPPPKHSSTVKIRASQDNMIKEEPFNQSHLNEAREYDERIANPLLAETNPVLKVPSQPMNQTSSEINIAATNQSVNLREMQRAYQGAPDESKRTFQPSEINNQSGYSDKPSDRMTLQRSQTQQQYQESLWDDPDLVPVPVLPVFSDNSVNYEVQMDNDGDQPMVRRGLPPSGYGDRPYFGGHSSNMVPTDHTIRAMQQMVPDLIATDEFEVQEIYDETTGEQQVLLSSKNSDNQFALDFPKQQFQTYKQSEAIDHDDGLSKLAPSVSLPKGRIPTMTDVTEVDGLKSARSRQEREMSEIEDIIRRAQKAAADTEMKEKELALKKQLQAGKPMAKPVTQKSVIGTPGATNSKSALITGDNEVAKMQTAAANVAPHRLGQMQRAAEEMEGSPFVSNDQKILSDLDRIIANLELQQKNMATFGMPQALNEDPDGEDRTSENKEYDEEETQWVEQEEHQDSGKQGNNPPFQSAAASKAPLNPRPKSVKSIKSRGTSAKGRGGIDASPQRIGKYAMMALQQQLGLNSKSNASPSPQRLGKFAQLALQNSASRVKGEDVDTISTKYARNPSRDRLEERSMASVANESRQMNQSNIGSQFAQPGGPILRPVSCKSGSSRYTASTKVANKAASPHAGEDQTSVQGFRQTSGTVAAGAMVSGPATAGHAVNNTSKLAYYSDEEGEDGFTANNQGSPARPGLRHDRLMSGKTQMTVQNQRSRINIADDNDNVELH